MDQTLSDIGHPAAISGVWSMCWLAKSYLQMARWLEPRSILRKDRLRVFQMPRHKRRLKLARWDVRGGSGVIVKAGEIGEQLHQLGAGLGGNGFKRLGACEEALRRGAFGQDDLVLIKQDVEILDVFHAFINLDAWQSCELDGGYESFAGAEHALGNAGAYEHTMLA